MVDDIYSSPDYIMEQYLFGASEFREAESGPGSVNSQVATVALSPSVGSTVISPSIIPFQSPDFPQLEPGGGPVS